MSVFGDNKEKSVSSSFLTWNVINHYLFILNTMVLLTALIFLSCIYCPVFLARVSFREASAKLATVIEQNFLFSEATFAGSIIH